MESRFWRRAARRRLGRFLIKIRRSASACVIACSVARILSSWREGDDRRERREGDSRKPRPRRRPPLAGETHVAPPIEGSHWGARVVAVGTRRRRPFRRGEGGREGGRDGARRRASEGGSPAPLQSLLGSHLELLCALQKCPLLHSSSPLPSLPSSRGVEDPHCVEDVRHHRGRRRRGLLQQHEERRRRRLQRQQDISDIKNDYHCSSTARTDGRRASEGRGRTSCYIVHLEGYHQEVVQEREREISKK